MSGYKLMYFGVRGYGETARMLFALTGTPYEDKRIDVKDWPSLKPEMPFGQLPVLEVENTKIAQSNAISRFLAEKFGLMGRNALEKATIDSCVETITDIRVNVMRVQIKQIPKDQKEKELRTVLEEAVQPTLARVEDYLKKNKAGDKYLVGDKMTLADVHFFACCETVVRLNPKAFAAFPKLAALYNRVKSHEKISKWIEQRPDTEV